MKTERIFSIILIISSLFFIQCKNQDLYKTKILNPTYKIYDISGERGYNVHFSLENPENGVKAVAVAVNGIKQKIADSNNGRYQVNVISESRKIAGYRPQTTTESNGIWLTKGEREIFLPVDFKLEN